MPSYLFLTIIAFTAMLTLAGEAFSRQVYYQPDKDESSLWIQGQSNINEFECISEKYSGSASIDNLNPAEPSGNHFHGDISLEVRIQVNGFECGRNRMNRDLQNALKADQHPEIIFRFGRAEIIESPEKEEDPFLIDVHGTLTAAGETRDIRFVAQGYYLEGYRVRAIGNSIIKMTDFNIDPPTALLGLVQADDKLTVNFDLTASEISYSTD